MQIQEPSPPDPHLHPCEDKKVNMIEWIPKQIMATPSRWLQRSASARADPPSPFSSNPAHEPVSTPTTPSAAAAAASFGCMKAAPTDTPPATPKDKPKAAPPSISAAAFAAFWSHPRRLMQRAARAFRSSRSRRRIKFDEPAPPPAPVTGGRVSDAASGGSMDAEHGSSDGNNNSSSAASITDADADDDNKMRQEERHNVDEIVPAEKIIHVANDHDHQAEAVEKAAADEEEKKVEEEEEPKKAGGAVEDDDTAGDVLADKFCMVVKEAMKKQKQAEEQEEDGTKKEAKSRFHGSRVKTAMEARAESEQPRRLEVVRSNDVIEEACIKLLAKRQGSRVRALVGAFETVMDAKPAAKPQHRYRQSSVKTN